MPSPRSPSSTILHGMTRILCDFVTILGQPWGESAAITVHRPRLTNDGRQVIVPREHIVPVVDGKAVFEDVDPGPARLHVRRSGFNGRMWDIAVPNKSEVDLADLLEGREEYTPAQVSAAKEAARRAEEAAESAWAAVDTPGRQGPQGPPGPRHPGPVLWPGQGAPPEVIAGARPGDKWIDVNTGDTYVLR